MIPAQDFGVYYLTTIDHVVSETLVTALLGRPPFHHWLLPKIIALNVGHRDEFSRAPHQSDYYGGIVATFIDLARHACVTAKLSRRARMMDVRVDYLWWTVDPDLTASARVLRAGPSVGMVDVDVRDSADRAIATGRCVFGTREN